MYTRATKYKIMYDFFPKKNIAFEPQTCSCQEKLCSYCKSAVTLRLILLVMLNPELFSEFFCDEASGSDYCWSTFSAAPYNSMINFLRDY